MDEFLRDAHGRVGCTGCHGGNSTAADKESAHEGVTLDPTEAPAAACGGCHQDISAAAPLSMHYLLSGERALIEKRAECTLDSDPNLHQAFTEDCFKCHATCGQCHVSRPKSVGGGLIEGHIFQRTPSMVNQCTACHGSRIGEEYRGAHKDQIPDYKGDVHYLKNSSVGGKHCANCHSGAEMHNGQADHRYSVAEMPRCEWCHYDDEATNDYHEQHWGELSCTVCHAQDYKSCNDCHVQGGGLSEPSYLSFKIGHNPRPDDRPYKYVTLRHIPIAETSYDPTGYSGGLPGYTDEPTWKMTTPHNIRRWTARTDTTGGRSCMTACHETPATVEGYFLRAVDLEEMSEDEAAANAALIVPDSPPTEWN